LLLEAPLPGIVQFLLALFAFSALGIPGLIEVPAPQGGANAMAILYTGDGGWRTTDRGLANTLAGRGVPVVALNTLQYFWRRRAPEEAAADFERILAHYLAVWKKKQVIVIGYSYGADVLPFILSRLPKPVISQVQLVALLSPTQNVDFQFHFLQWFVPYVPETARPVLPELGKPRGLRILTFCGDRDRESLCRVLPSGLAQTVLLHAGHRLDRFYKEIARDILNEAGFRDGS
jgi:type IV secretory pathway VirJ component